MAKKPAVKSRLSPRSAKKAASKPGAKGRRGRPTAQAKRPTKASLILAMATRPEGASMEELRAAFNNQEHTLRAIISVESRKAGVKVKMVEGRYRTVKE